MKRIEVHPAVKAEFDRLNEVLKDTKGEWHNHILNIIINYIECFAKMHGIEWIEADAALRSHKGDLIEEYKEEGKE